MARLTDEQNKRLRKLQEALDKDYAVYKPIYEDIRDYMLPLNGHFADTGDVREPDLSLIYDNTASLAINHLAAGLMSGLCSPSRPWARITLRDRKLAQRGRVSQWLDHLTRRFYSVANIGGFYNAVHNGFEEIAGFGKSVVIPQEDGDVGARYFFYPVGTYRFARGRNGDIDIFFAYSWPTARELVRRFGTKNLRSEVISASKDAPEMKFKLCHAIFPREDYDPQMEDGINMPYASVWYEMGDTEHRILREHGYKRFMPAVTRWHECGTSPYGLGPGFLALGGTKVLQEYEKAKIKGLHRYVDPPLNVPSSYRGLIDLRPGGINKFTPGTQDRVSPTLEVRFPYSEITDHQDRARMNVRDTFFNNVVTTFLNSAETARTATEVQKIYEEKMLQLGPVVERQIKEFLNPLVLNTVTILITSGWVEPPPPEIQGAELDVEYLSVMAQAQKLVSAQPITAYVTMVERLATFNQDILVKTDWDALLDHYADIIGLDHGIIRDPEAAADIRARQAAEMQKQRQMEQAQMASQTVQNLSGAQLRPDNALGVLSRTMGVPYDTGGAV